MAMTSSRPYMVRALYEWIIDNDLTPHIVVNAQAEGTLVPQQYLNKDDQIVLNIAPRAVAQLKMDNDAITFNARFGGIPTDIYVPSEAVMGIYAKESGQGMMFETDILPDPDPDGSSKPPKSEHPPSDNSGDKRPSLRIVK